MIDYFLINNLALVLIDVLGILLALWVYFANKKEKINRGFFLMVISILSWITFYHLASLPSQRGLSLVLFRLATASVFLFFIFYYLFIVRWFLDKKGFYKFFGKFIFIYGFIFSLISVFTNSIIVTLQFNNGILIPIFSSWGWLVFYGYVIFLTILINVVLLIDYSKSSKEKKVKIQYFLIGMLIFAVLNFIFNVIFPVWIKNYKFYQLGNYSAIFLLGFTASAVVKQKLFNIKVVTTQLFIFALWITLLIRMFLVEDLIDMFINGGIFIAVLIFGILVVRSVLQEVKNRELTEDLAKSLDEANLRLRQLDKAKSEFVSIASHQLRTPLTAIKGYTSMLVEGSYGEVSTEVKKVLDKIFLSTNRLVLLIGDFLNLSRIERGKIEYNLQKIDLKQLLSNIVEEFKAINISEDKKLNLKFEIDEAEEFSVNIDSDKIRQVIYNLVDNAMKYTNKGFIKIILNKDPDQKVIIVKVQDSGMGMNKETLNKIFQKFSRAAGSSKLYTEGTGLGLYVGMIIVKAHKGRVWGESEGEGKGSTFYLELPAV